MYSLFVYNNLKCKEMRKRINRAAVCSSENYEVSRRLHLESVINSHNTFTGMAVAREAKDYNGINYEALTDKYVTVKVFGKPIKVTKKEYEERYAPLGFKAL